MNKKLKIIFTLSLVINIFLIGGIGGYIFKPHGGSRDWHDMKERLSPETRAVMKDTFQSRRQDVREIFKDARQKKKALVDAFSAEEFDPVAYDNAANDLLHMGTRLSQHKIDSFKVLAEKLPHNERVNLARSFAESLIGRHGRKHWRKPTEKGSKAHDLGAD